MRSLRWLGICVVCDGVLTIGLCGGLVVALSLGGCGEWSPKELGAQVSSLPMIPVHKLPRRTSLLHHSLVYRGETRRDAAVTVRYDSRGLDVHDHYQREIKRLGWKKVGALGPEDRTKCGGDWGGYYQKGLQQMQFHICGPEGLYAMQDGRMQRQVVLLNVWVTTYGFHPRQLLGREYKSRGGPRKR